MEMSLIIIIFASQISGELQSLPLLGQRCLGQQQSEAIVKSPFCQFHFSALPDKDPSVDFITLELLT